MSSDLGLDKTLELLDRLKGTVSDFAAREEKLEHEFRTRTAGDAQRRDEAIENEVNGLAADINKADAACEAGRKEADAQFEKRKSNIGRARTTSKEQALQRIENHTGALKYELQKKLMQTDRDREAAIAGAASALEDFKNNLTQEQDNLAALEKRARTSISGQGKFNRALSRAANQGGVDSARDENQLLVEIRESLGKARCELDGLKKSTLPSIPLWLLTLVCLLALAPPLFRRMGADSMPASYSLQSAIVVVMAVFAIGLAARFFGSRGAGPAVSRIVVELGKAQRWLDVGWDNAESHYQRELLRVEQEHKSGTETIDQQLKQAVNENFNLKGSFRERVDEKTMRILGKNEKLHREKLGRLEREHAEAVDRMKHTVETRKEELMRLAGENEAKLKSDYQTRWQTLESDWKAAIQPIHAVIESARTRAEKAFPAWEPRVLENWKPPTEFEHAAKFAQLEIELKQLCEATPKDPRLALPGPPHLALPLLLTYPEQGSILFETTNAPREDMIGALNNVILRLLSVAPPGRLNFTIIDPVGLGQNFAGVMHLADYEPQIINSRIWTQTAQIEQRLADLNEHMEKVIQMYLRNEYETIADYNKQAGNIAEKYHFLVVADFPANFSEVAIKRLLSIATSGARCGVYTLIHWDHRQSAPPDFVPDDLRKSSVSITAKRDGEAVLTGRFIQGTKLVLDPPPATEFATEFIHKVGRSSRDSSRVEVPFSHVAPPEAEQWTLDTTNELRMAIGRTGATKLQYLAIGKGTRQHALIAGKTGSGKSTLFHVIITNLSLWCSPDQVEFYLVDFKKGVEFKCYAAKQLPHARVVAIESDREFGLSVLQRVDDELRRRGDLFRKLGAQDIAGYKRAGGKEAIPRSLLMIDEFQEFFVEDDKVSQTASVLLDRIVRQGRAFGIHVLLGSQTLGGAYTLARTTLGQMVIRIALQCNEADAYLIMDENNPAPRLLSRPGEGIYNDAAGSVEGNNPFQVVWLPDNVRDENLDHVRARAKKAPVAYPTPVVFEGNAPSDVRENGTLRELLEAKAIKPVASPRIWLGAPNSIKGPTEAVFHRQSGNNLVIVGQRDEAAMAILSVALVSLAAQYPAGAARFLLFDGNPPGSPQREYLERIVRAIPHKIAAPKSNEIAEAMNELVADLKKRAEEPAAETPATFLFFHGLQKFNKLRHEEDFSFSAGDAEAANPAAQLNQILSEGASQGFHVIATFDTYNNVNRFLSRKAFGEFEMRVLFQMSANDSASLIDSPKASTLGLHRALFYNEQEGYLETFRPYALPDNEWIEQAALNLSRLLK